MSVTESTKTFAPAGTWSADPVHTHVGFEVEYAGVNTFRGSFADFSVTLTGGSEPTLEGSAKVASVDVKDENLSGHLQTPDFFDAARYPEISFKATDLQRLDDDTVVGSGELTIKGVTQQIELISDGLAVLAHHLDGTHRTRFLPILIRELRDRVQNLKVEVDDLAHAGPQYLDHNFAAVLQSGRVHLRN